ncbi:hypothetical protein AYL99_04233 [Fonsecaea erecta]|uniref:Catalase n=1 Tax=Fonsecaea erecta TaxID=1367422 RepID=A0A178ZQE4_9EURO|nr:hypothetical protein AYL99_04233 [Fonsecaea erecta]OAP62030.1 hypothetical protein AYL99_04233 [Fonsecaea erecta]
MLYQTLLWATFLVCATVEAQDATDSKLGQLQAATIDTEGQTETTDNGVQANSNNSLRAGPRGYVLLEDTVVRKKLLHFDRERAPERVVHALGHGAYGMFQSYADWSNLTMACWLQNNATSEVFTRFSVVVSSTGGSEVQRDTHGFATKIYSQCGNQDLVGNHVPSFFINDGSEFPDLVHSVKFESDKGFPTGGSAHTTAYDFFAQHPEGAAQLMYVLSDLGLPRDVRHISGNGVHTYRFINGQGNSTLFKWYWLPVLGHRSLVYDEVTTLAGKNANFQRIDLYNNIANGIFPEWEFAVQLFPDDGTYMWQGYDLTEPTQIIPFEDNPPMKLGKLTLNRNPTNFFAEPESVSFAPSNVVDGVSWVPDALLQWRLMAYDDTSTHRHNSPNGYTLPINRPIAPVYNNYRDGYMQPSLFKGESTSSPDGLGGVQPAGPAQALMYAGISGTGKIGRYRNLNYDWAAQARAFWGTLDAYGQQHLVDGYRFELGHVTDPNVTMTYINTILNPIDNCLARRVAYGIGAVMPALGTGGPITQPGSNKSYPSLYPLNPGVESNKSNAGLTVAIIADDNMLTVSDLQAMEPILSSQQVGFDIVAPHVGMLASSVNATSSYTLTSEVMYDAVFIGSSANGSISTTPNSMAASHFILDAYAHGKPIAALGSNGAQLLQHLQLNANSSIGLYTGNVPTVTMNVLNALSGPARFFQRFPVDDPAICL